MSTPSTFFITFSLRELANTEEAGQWGILGFIGGPIGHGVGMGATVGGSSGYLNSGAANCSRSESLSLPVAVSGHDRFDEPGFIKSLKARLEQLIIDNAAQITQAGDIPGSFHSNEFYVEYHQGKIQGRIVLSGSLSGTAYRLRAQIEERSEAGGFEIHAKSDGGLSLADVFRMMKPEGDYYVVALAHDHPLAQNNELQQVGQELMRDSVKRIRRGMRDGLKDLKSAEVWSLVKWPSNVGRLLAENKIEHTFEVPEEYQAYEAVFFLNDVALKMYNEAGIELEVLKKISGAEMPGGCVRRTLGGPYIPK